MKIGILTFHCAHNYGAVLQCYALQEYFKYKGHEVEVIDYRPSYIVKPYTCFNINRNKFNGFTQILKNVIIEFILFSPRLKRYKGFHTFINKNLNLSSKVIGKSIPSSYDLYVVGSDQVWNRKITSGFDSVYFADFSFKKGDKKYISYAASMELPQLSEEDKKYLSSAIKSFDSISVRESHLRKLLQPLSDKKIYQVLDPTLLIDNNIWNKVVSLPHISNKYVLVYQVRWNQHTMEVANKIAKQIGAIVIEAVAWLDIHCFRNKYQTASPEQFLGLIKQSECVITTSFHGTALSLVFNKPFYTLLLNDDKDTRSLSLLESLGIQDRAISLDSIPSFSTIDFTEVNQKLKQIRTDSMQFLDSML